MTQPTSRLGELLVEQGLLTRAMLEKVLGHQRLSGGSFGLNLLELGVVSEPQLLMTLGLQLDTPIVGTAELRRISPVVIDLLPAHLARKHQVVPFRVKGNTLFVASSRPGNITIENEIALATSRLTRTFLAVDVRVREALHRHYSMAIDTRMLNLLRRLEDDSHRGGPSPPVSLHSARPVRAATTRTVNSPQTPGGAEAKAIIEEEATTIVVAAPPTASDETAPQLDWQSCTSREEVENLLLDYCAESFRRRILLVVRSGEVVGWRADGAGVKPRHLEQFRIPLETTPFHSLDATGRPLSGILPEEPRSLLQAVLGRIRPPNCLIVPIQVAHKTVLFLYLDNMDELVPGELPEQVRMSCLEAGTALERLIRSRKKPAVEGE